MTPVFQTNAQRKRRRYNTTPNAGSRLTQIPDSIWENHILRNIQNAGDLQRVSSVSPSSMPSSIPKYDVCPLFKWSQYSCDGAGWRLAKNPVTSKRCWYCPTQSTNKLPPHKLGFHINNINDIIELNIPSRESQLLVCHDRGLDVWSIDMKRRIRILCNEQDVVCAKQLSNYLVVSLSSNFVAQLWNVEDGTLVNSANLPHSEPIPTFARRSYILYAVNDERIIIEGNYGIVFVFDEMLNLLHELNTPIDTPILENNLKITTTHAGMIFMGDENHHARDHSLFLRLNLRNGSMTTMSWSSNDMYVKIIRCGELITLWDSAGYVQTHKIDVLEGGDFNALEQINIPVRHVNQVVQFNQQYIIFTHGANGQHVGIFEPRTQGYFLVPPFLDEDTEILQIETLRSNRGAVVVTGDGELYRLHTVNLQRGEAKTNFIGTSWRYSQVAVLKTHHMPVDILVCWKGSAVRFFHIGS